MYFYNGFCSHNGLYSISKSGMTHSHSLAPASMYLLASPTVFSSYILKLEASGSRLVGFPPDTQPFTAPPWLYPALCLGPRSKGRFNRLRSKNLNPSAHNSTLL